MKLQHVSGYVTCNTLKPVNSYWGCYGHPTRLFTAITDEQENIIFPSNSGILKLRPYKRDFFPPGKNDLSPELILPSVTPVRVSRGQVFKVWYTEDLMQHTVSDNGGTHCVKVYASYV